RVRGPPRARAPSARAAHPRRGVLQGQGAAARGVRRLPGPRVRRRRARDAGRGPARSPREAPLGAGHRPGDRGRDRALRGRAAALRGGRLHPPRLRAPGPPARRRGISGRPALLPRAASPRRGPLQRSSPPDRAAREGTVPAAPPLRRLSARRRLREDGPSSEEALMDPRAKRALRLSLLALFVVPPAAAQDFWAHWG